VAAATARTACSNTGSAGAEGARIPLTLRTYCLAAASISVSVATGSRPRSTVMFRHMAATLGPAAGSALACGAQERAASSHVHPLDGLPAGWAGHRRPAVHLVLELVTAKISVKVPVLLVSQRRSPARDRRL
jgi:hypothetical protein